MIPPQSTRDVVALLYGVCEFVVLCALLSLVFVGTLVACLVGYTNRDFRTVSDEGQS